MTVLITLVLTIAASVFIAYPLLKRRLPSTDLVEDEKQRELFSKRDTTYSMLKELEFDLQSGILTNEDYRDMETRYKAKAISILRDIDSLEETPALEEEIEKQVQRLRRVKSSSVDEEVEKEVLELRRGKSRFCSQCGTRCREGDRFCSRCGASLSQGENVD